MPSLKRKKEVADTKNVDASEEVHHILENCTKFDHEFYMNWKNGQLPIRCVMSK